MRKLYITLSVIAAILGLVLTILPTEKIGLIALVLSIIFSVLAINKSEISAKNLPKFLLLFAGITLIIGLVKIFAIKDEVVIDQKDEIIKVESQKQDKKDLEELEGL